MRVAVIGPGRVGGALALALRRAGHEIVAVATRTTGSRSHTPDGGSPHRSTDAAGSRSSVRFAALLPDVPTRPLAAVGEGADLVLVTTPDDALPAVARAIALADGVSEGQRWIHTAGGIGVEGLSAIAAAGGRVAACHPAMTFPDPATGADLLPGSAWAVTAAERDLGWASALVADLGGSPVVVAGKDRTLYHAALAVGSNGTTAVVTLARDLLLGAGITDPAAFLGPIVTASAVGGAQRGVQALTGPIRRGDVGTVRAHLRELQTSFPEVAAAYRALAELILSQAVRGGLTAAAAEQVRAALTAADPTAATGREDPPA